MPATAVGEKTQVGQEHVYNGQGSGWSPRAIAQVHDIYEEMSRSIANANCWRTPGPSVQTTRKGTDTALWNMLKRRIVSHQQQRAHNLVRVTNSGSTYNFNRNVKLFGIRSYILSDSTISVKPVNPKFLPCHHHIYWKCFNSFNCKDYSAYHKKYYGLQYGKMKRFGGAF